MILKQIPAVDSSQDVQEEGTISPSHSSESSTD